MIHMVSHTFKERDKEWQKRRREGMMRNINELIIQRIQDMHHYTIACDLQTAYDVKSD